MTLNGLKCQLNLSEVHATAVISGPLVGWLREKKTSLDSVMITCLITSCSFRSGDNDNKIIKISTVSSCSRHGVSKVQCRTVRTFLIFIFTPRFLQINCLQNLATTDTDMPLSPDRDTPHKPWYISGFGPVGTRGARHMSTVHVHMLLELVSGPRLLWKWLNGRYPASRLAGHTQVGLAFYSRPDDYSINQTQIYPNYIEKTAYSLSNVV